MESRLRSAPSSDYESNEKGGALRIRSAVGLWRWTVGDRLTTIARSPDYPTTTSTIALLLTMFVQAGCATTKVAGGASPSLEGAELSVGDRTYHLEACQSGDLAYFLGVDLADQSGSARVRVAIDPMAGPRLRVVLRQDEPRTMTFDQDQCRQLHAEVTPTGWHVNTVRDVSGFVDAECTNAGQQVALHVRFSHCH